MKFTDVLPTDWRDLQNQAARYFREAGYEAKTPYKIKTARGEVEVDVYVEAPLELCKLVLCECKYWDGNIPQEKIHAFRTVVSDSGASLGIVIAKSGFQSGAYEAAQYTNVQLKTWDEFLDMVRIRWITCQLRALKKKRSPLSVYLDFMGIPFDKLSPQKKEEYRQASKDYVDIECTISYLSVIDLADHPRWEFSLYGCVTVEQYIQFLDKKVDEAIECLSSIFAGIPIEEYKFDLPDRFLYWSL